MTLGDCDVATEEGIKSNQNEDISYRNLRSGGGKVDCASMGDVEARSNFRKVRVVMSKHHSMTEHDVVTARR